MLSPHQAMVKIWEILTAEIIWDPDPAAGRQLCGAFEWSAVCKELYWNEALDWRLLQLAVDGKLRVTSENHFSHVSLRWWSLISHCRDVFVVGHLLDLYDPMGCHFPWRLAPPFHCWVIGEVVGCNIYLPNLQGFNCPFAIDTATEMAHIVGVFYLKRMVNFHSCVNMLNSQRVASLAHTEVAIRTGWSRPGRWSSTVCKADRWLSCSG